MFSVEQYGTDVVLIPRCDLDMSSRDAFASALAVAAGAADGRVIVSLDRCKYIDSSGLGVLSAAVRTLPDRLSIAVSPDVRIARIFQITKFHEIVPIFPSLAAASGGSKLVPS